MRRYASATSETVRQLLTKLTQPLEGFGPDEYRRAMTRLGQLFVETFRDRLANLDRLLLVCTNEDADYLAQGVLTGLETIDGLSVNVACFWNDRKTVSSSTKPDYRIEIAPIIRRYVEHAKVSAFLVVKSIIASGCVIQSNLNDILYEHRPKQVLIFAPVILTGVDEKLREEFDDEFARRFEFLWFAEDDQTSAGLVVPGIGGSVYERLGLGTSAEKNRYIPNLVKDRRRLRFDPVVPESLPRQTQASPNDFRGDAVPVDPVDIEASRVEKLTIEADQSLLLGDTETAARKFHEAGEWWRIQAERVQRPNDRHQARYVAALLYFKGGHYQAARKHVGKVKENRLQQHQKVDYRRLFQECERRASKTYPASVKQKIDQCLREGNHQRILELLEQHPFVLSPLWTAYGRARSWLKLGDPLKAAPFFAIASKTEPGNPAYHALYIDCLCRAKKYDEAWLAVTARLQSTPDFQAFVSAITVKALQAESAEQSARADFRAAQVEYYQPARARYREMEEARRLKAAKWMTLALVSTWLAYLDLNDEAKQLEVLGDWIELQPNAPEPYVTRAITTYPGDGGVSDAEAAIRLGTGEFEPYCILAHAKLTQSDFSRADDFCDQALNKIKCQQTQPSDAFVAQLYHWQAIAWANLGRPAADVRAKFVQVEGLNPTEPYLSHNLQVFEESQSQGRRLSRDFRWNGQWRPELLSVNTRHMQEIEVRDRDDAIKQAFQSAEQD